MEDPRLPPELVKKVLSSLALLYHHDGELWKYRLVSPAWDQLVQEISMRSTSLYIPRHQQEEDEGYPLPLVSSRWDEDQPFEAYAAALSENTGMLNGAVVRTLTLKGSPVLVPLTRGTWITYRIHACTIVRILGNLPNLESLTLVSAALASCPHDPPCIIPTPPSGAPPLGMLKLENVFVAEAEHPPRPDHLRLLQYLRPTTLVLLGCTKVTCNYPPPTQSFSAHSFIVDQPGRRLLLDFQAVKHVTDLRVWIRGMEFDQWEETKKIIVSNRAVLRRVFIGQVPMPGTSFNSLKVLSLLTSCPVWYSFGVVPKSIGLEDCTALQHVTLAFSTLFRPTGSGDYQYEDYATDTWVRLLTCARSMPSTVLALRVVFLLTVQDDAFLVISTGRWKTLCRLLNAGRTTLRLELELSGNLDAGTWDEERVRKDGSVVTAKGLLSSRLSQFGVEGMVGWSTFTLPLLTLKHR